MPSMHLSKDSMLFITAYPPKRKTDVELLSYRKPRKGRGKVQGRETKRYSQRMKGLPAGGGAPESVQVWSDRA